MWKSPLCAGEPGIYGATRNLRFRVVCVREHTVLMPVNRRMYRNSLVSIADSKCVAQTCSRNYDAGMEKAQKKHACSFLMHVLIHKNMVECA